MKKNFSFQVQITMSHNLSQSLSQNLFSSQNMSPPPFDTIGLFTFLRTYSRRHKEDDANSTIESWKETLERVVNACRSQLKVGFTPEEEHELFSLLYNLKCSVAGRFLWQLGTKTVDNLGLPSLQNCFRRDTEFWTSEGIRSFNDFQDGDKVIIIGREKYLPATVKNFGQQKLVKLTVQLRGENRYIYTTANHRWIVVTEENKEENKEEIIETSSLQSNQILACGTHTSLFHAWKVFSVEETDLVEDVWCVVEPEEEIFTLADGILTKNCAVCVVNEPVSPFTWTMNFLMLGCGVGFRILPEDIANIPEVKYVTITRKDTKDADFIVPDSREGWVKLLGKVLKSHFYSGTSFTYSCTLLRSKGAPIKSFGGVASGPDVLVEGMETINKILNKRAGQKIRPVDALDIMNVIGHLVKSGNVRRSALLCLGDCNDTEYLKAKRWDLGNIPNYRANSNNSVVCNDISEILENKDFWEGYNGNGEPYGLINLKLSQSCGRLGETQYPDPECVGYNPCFSGDTMVAVADGRKAVSIKQLAEEGKDVPVYSLDPEGNTCIKWGRNPRITGEKQKLIRIWFARPNTGEYLDVTPNHKILLNNGRTIEAKDLQKGDSIPKFERYKDKYHIVRINSTTRTAEHRLIAEFYMPEKFRENYNEEVKNGFCNTKNVVVHHKDEDKTNNCIDNLEITTPGEHCSHHGKQYAGENNPMFGKEHSEETKNLIGEKAKERWQNEEYREKMIALQNTEERKKLASENMKKTKLEIDIRRSASVEEKAKEVGLKSVRLTEKIVQVEKICETCKEPFLLPWGKREHSYCSAECGNKGASAIANRRAGRLVVEEEKSKEVFHKQAMLYKDMEEKSEGKKITQKDFFQECSKLNIPHRFQTHSPNKWIARNWGHFKEMVNGYNHRVSYIEELPGEHTVYNITVEDTHIVGIVVNGTLGGVFTPNCGEMSISERETCCLSELYLPNISSKEELFTCATYLYRICKHSLTLPCNSSKETEKIVHKNMRMGIGVTGYLQATDEQRSWLSDCYKHLRTFDLDYSQKHNFPPSIKLTTTKPSGSLSLLGGVTAGVHPGFARYYKRRIRISSNHSLIEIAKKHGYHVEYARQFDGTIDHTTQIVSFPIKLPDNTVLAENCTAIDQLEWVKKLQTDWSDNSVSVTVYYRKQELPAIKEWLRVNYNNSVKTVSFLLHNDHGFDQAPLEQITKEEYETMKASCQPITDLQGICYTEESLESIAQGECAGGACPLR